MDGRTISYCMHSYAGCGDKCTWEFGISPLQCRFSGLRWGFCLAWRVQASRRNRPTPELFGFLWNYCKINLWLFNCIDFLAAGVSLVCATRTRRAEPLTSMTRQQQKLCFFYSFLYLKMSPVKGKGAVHIKLKCWKYINIGCTTITIIMQ